MKSIQKLSEVQQARVVLYEQKAAFFRTKFREHLSSRQYEIASGFLDTDLNQEQVGALFDIGGRYVSDIVYKALLLVQYYTDLGIDAMLTIKQLTAIGFTHTVSQARPYQCQQCGRSYRKEGPELYIHADSHKKLVTQPAPQKPDEEVEASVQQTPSVTKAGWPFQSGETGKILPREEFDYIKEQLFRGESISTISQLSHRATLTLAHIRSAATYDEYVQSRTFKKKTPQTQRTVAKVPAPSPASLDQPYERLYDLRKSLEQAFIAIIQGEIEEERKAWNKKFYEQEAIIKGLKQRVAELESPDFREALRHALKGEQQHA